MLKQCPICHTRTDPKAESYPFCSARCRTQDLANWSTESYRVWSPLTEADEYLDGVDTSADSEEHA